MRPPCSYMSRFSLNKSISVYLCLASFLVLGCFPVVDFSLVYVNSLVLRCSFFVSFFFLSNALHFTVLIFLYSLIESRACPDRITCLPSSSVQVLVLWQSLVLMYSSQSHQSNFALMICCKNFWVLVSAYDSTVCFFFVGTSCFCTCIHLHILISSS